MQMQYDIIKLNTGSIPFSNKKFKGREKTSNERKKCRCKFLRKSAPTKQRLHVIVSYSYML